MTKEEYKSNKDKIVKDLVKTLTCGSDLPDNSQTHEEILFAIEEAIKLYANYISSQHACDSCGNGICLDRDLVTPLPKTMCNGYMEKSND